MKLKGRIAILSVLMFLILFPSFICSEFWMKFLIKNNLFTEKNENKVRLAEYWNLTGTPISIDGNAEWITTALTQPWCNGSGTWNDPYIIENVTLDGQNSGSCIEIRNSNVFFIIRNCTLYNSGSVTDDAGIFLYRTNNGQLINNNCSSNGLYGIYLDDCNNNSIVGNSVNENNQAGIGFFSSDHNSVLFNKAQGNDKGLYLEVSDYNNIFGNNLSNNINYGYRFQSSNFNNISGNTANSNWFEFYFSVGNNNTISKNIINMDEKGIYLGAGFYNKITENEINGSVIGPTSIGIDLYSGGDSLILRNRISFCNTGIKIGSSDNLLSENHILNNTKGIFLEDGFRNNLFKNYFTGNTIHAIDDPTDVSLVNNWNNTIGNYWDNHSTGDANGDGIDDTPYDIPGLAGNNDFRPFFGNPLIPPNTIHIDGTGVSAPNWDWAVANIWCKGSGTSEDPYIIEDLTLNAGEAAHAILIENSNAFFKIENCTILNFTGTGIKLNKSNNGQLINNNCTSNVQYGIYLDSSNSTIISNNTINDFSFGIRLENSSHNSIIENSANGNNQVGIYLFTDCYFNNISSNTINNNNFGISLQGSYYNDILRNEIDGSLFYGIVLENGGNNSIYENTVIYNEWGIRIYYSTFETIYNNTINNNDYGIRIINGEECNISANEIDQNDYGLFLDQEAPGLDNNLISENLFSNSFYWGIKITSSPNLIFLNNFTGNPIHAISDGINNTWDNGVIGNYWDNYTGNDLDDDGIGDTPYSITGLAGSQDYYPIWDDGDEDAPPVIVIIRPVSNQVFGTNAPNFQIDIKTLYTNSTWYTIDNGITNYTFSGFTGTVNQTAWDNKGTEIMTLRFYANDSLGNLGFKDVLIWKDLVAPQITINSPTPNQLCGVDAPTFSLTIIEPNIQIKCYSFNGRPNITFTTETQFNQSEWNNAGNGTVLITFYIEDKAGNMNSSEVIVRKDANIPVITIISPILDEIFGTSAPSYTISINEPNLDSIWYTIDGGFTNITITNLSGTINQGEWDRIGIERVNIIFYANDTVGNIGQKNVFIEKYYAYWPINPLIIDDSGGGNYRWGEAVTQGWCSGSGTIIDPYIIEFLEIDGQGTGSCIIISNSIAFFIIRNCSFYNSGNDQNDAGIELINISNGELIYLNSSFNNGNGILLDSCQNVNITNSTVDYNGFSGIKLIDCNYINILDNTDTINWNDEYGIYLISSHNNVITNNLITHNSVGIYLDQSNSNYIDWNNLLNNVQAIVDAGSDNDFGLNNIIPDVPYGFPFEILIIILIIGIVAVGVTGAVLLGKKRMSISGVKKKEISEKKREKVRKKLEEKLTFVDYLINENKIQLAYKNLGKVKDTADTYDFNDIFNKASKKVEQCKDIEAGIHREVKREPFVAPAVKEKLEEEKKLTPTIERDIVKIPKGVPVIKKGKKYNIFVSYSSLDLDHFQINKIVDGLEKYPEIEKVYYYIKDSGQNIVEFMEKTLRISDTFVLFCTEHSRKSKSVEGEWQAAYQLSKKGVVKIIPVYDNEEDVPILLMPFLNVKFTKYDLDGFIEKLYEEILR